MKQFKMLIKCACNINFGLTYQKCRFCGAGWPELKHLWKYAVRHYICDGCLIKKLESRHISSWSSHEEEVYNVITGQHSLQIFEQKNIQREPGRG